MKKNPKFSDETELDTWYEDQKRLFLESVESAAKDKKEAAEAEFKSKLGRLMEDYERIKSVFIEKELETHRKRVANKIRGGKK